MLTRPGWALSVRANAPSHSGSARRCGDRKFVARLQGMGGNLGGGVLTA